MKNIIPFRFFILFIIACATAFSLSTKVFADGTEVSAIYSDTTWDAEHSPYIIRNNINVPAGMTLAIAAGTEVRVADGKQIVVHGAVVANGTADNPVTIDGLLSANIPPPGQQSDQNIVATIAIFDGLRFEGNATGTFSYLKLGHASAGIMADENATVSVDLSVFTNCVDAFYTTSGAVHLTVTKSYFSYDQSAGTIDVSTNFSHADNLFANTMLGDWRVEGSSYGVDVEYGSADGSYILDDSLQITKGHTLTVDPGVNIYLKQNGPILRGQLQVLGTTEHPVSIVGDGGQCNTYVPSLTILGDSRVPTSATSSVFSHMQIHDLCGGIKITHSIVAFDTVGFLNIPGVAVQAVGGSVLKANDITMDSVGGGFSIDDSGTFNIVDSVIKPGGTAAEPADSGIVIAGGSSGDIQNTTVQSAKVCVESIGSSTLAVDHSIVSDCSVVGIKSADPTGTTPSSVSITNTEVSNSILGVSIDNGAVKNISDNNIHDNTNGVSLANMDIVDVRNNWWGSKKGPTISTNPGGDGQSLITDTVKTVLYKPWLEMVGGTSVSSSGVGQGNSGQSSSGQNSTDPTQTPPSNQTDTSSSVSTVHNPLILIPGITGTRLLKAYGDKSEVWPNITQMILDPLDIGLNILSLLSTGLPDPKYPIALGDIIRSVHGTDVFDGLIAQLEKDDGYKEGVDLFVFPYDWRLSNASNAVLLKQKIDKVLIQTKKQKADIIAHSMGGLLAKSYVAQFGQGAIDRLFFVGTPHLGVPKVFKLLMYGDDMGISKYFISFLNQDRIKTIVQNMISLFELLPSKKYVSTIGTYVEDVAGKYLSASHTDRNLTYDEASLFMVQEGRNAAIVPLADKLHASIDSVALDKIKTYDFSGCATKAISNIVITKKWNIAVLGAPVINNYHLEYGNGDGTVPLASAMAGDYTKNFYVTVGDHSDLPSLVPVRDAIAALLLDKSVPKSDTMTSAKASCGIAGKAIEIHSPVTLDIYDDQNRHTGLNAQGDIENSIPDVTYDTIGEEKFAFLPDGPTYRVVNHALGVGTYDMYINDVAKNDAITTKRFYSEIPITSLAMNAQTTIGPDGASDYTVKIDQDGDGVFESSILPSAKLSEKKSLDIVPPVTTAVIKNTELTFTATDDSSGVLKTYYSTDKNHWIVYPKKSITDVSGQSVSYFSIDNVGNYEDIKTVTVPTAAVSTTNTKDTNSSSSSAGASTSTNSSTTTTSTQTSSAGGGGFTDTNAQTQLPTTTTATSATNTGSRVATVVPNNNIPAVDRKDSNSAEDNSSDTRTNTETNKTTSDVPPVDDSTVPLAVVKKSVSSKAIKNKSSSSKNSVSVETKKVTDVNSDQPVSQSSVLPPKDIIPNTALLAEAEPLSSNQSFMVVGVVTFIGALIIILRKRFPKQ